jgi:hypothetical protein
LSDLGKALYGLAAPRAAQWAERRKEELDTGRFRALLPAIRRQVSRSDAARRCLHYFQTNRERMRYPEFHANGPPFPLRPRQIGPYIRPDLIDKIRTTAIFENGFDLEVRT